MNFGLSLLFAICFLSLASLSSVYSIEVDGSDQNQVDGGGIVATNATELNVNVSKSRAREDSFAGMIDRALEKEFTEGDQNEGK